MSEATSGYGGRVDTAVEGLDCDGLRSRGSVAADVCGTYGAASGSVGNMDAAVRVSESGCSGRIAGAVTEA